MKRMVPAAGDEDRLLRPDSRGAKGALLPDFALPAPALVMTVDRQESINALRLVSLHLHPCSPNINASDRSQCQAVLNLMWQPVHPAQGATPATAADAAVHTFYILSPGEERLFLAGLLALRARSPLDTRLPLSVHPVIQEQGLRGSYYQGLRSLLLEAAGERNLHRMTYAALRANTTRDVNFGQGWLFSGAEFSGGQVSLVVVATTNDKEQHFGNNPTSNDPIEEVDVFKGDFIPPTATTDALLAIVGDSAAAMSAPLSSIQAAVDQALRIENPRLHTQETVDCVSCHVATAARLWAEQHRGIDSRSNRYRFSTTSFDLTLTSQVQQQTNALRGLGYYGSRAAISQRTVNDSAAAADFINETLLVR